MPLGPGKYDDECGLVRELTDAQTAILIVFSGKRGNGFAMQGSLDRVLDIPATLRRMADQIEADLKQGKI